jgi:predicted nucleic acid-binding protein
MRILVDTNILLRFTETAHAHHVVARDALAEVGRLGHELCIVPQIIYEFWAVATRPIENHGLAMNVQDTRIAVVDAKSFFRLLRDERSLFERWERLVVQYDAKGKTAHDARLVAAMLRHGVSHLLTFNDRDFARYPDKVAVHPTAAIGLPMAGES